MEFVTYFECQDKQHEICIFKTPLVKDNIFAFSDLQQSDTENEELFDVALENISNMGYDIRNFTFVCAGDMYGITGRMGGDGVPNYDLYDKGKDFFYVYGNHDLCPEPGMYNNINEARHIPKTMDSGTTIVGIHGIKSDKNNYPQKYSRYDTELKKIRNADILLSHDTPYNNNKLHTLPHKLHIYGHRHYDYFLKIKDSKTYINTDRRFVLLLPI